jgi:SAM-dependent methyltransferase
MSMTTSITERYRSFSDEEWFDAIRRSVRDASLGLPTFPRDALVRRANYAELQAALTQASEIFQVIERMAGTHGRPLGPASTVLDYGCGWGRVARFFLRDVLAANLTGCDVDRDLVAACQKAMPDSNFITIEPHAPLPFADESFEVIYAVSVLSHLPADVHIQVVSRLARVLRRGGVLVATTLGPRFLGLMQGWARSPRSELKARERKWLNALPDPDAAIRRYESGELVSGVTGTLAHLLPGYGIAFAPERWVHENWPDALDVVDINHDIWSQTVITARKRDRP